MSTKCICKMKRWQNCEFFSIFLIKEGWNKCIKLLCKMKLWDKLQKEEVVGKCSVKKLFLKTSQNSQENTFVGVYFLIKLQASGLNQMFSLEFGEIFQELFLKRTPLKVASVQKVYFCQFFVKKKVLNLFSTCWFN